MTRRPLQLDLRTPSWGGRRAGAGRKPSGRRTGVPHRARPTHHASHPAHVTLRARAGLPSLRTPRLFPVLRCALAKTSRRGFRLLQFSVQHDHVHALVEADGHDRFIRGSQGLAIRLAKAVNRSLGRRGKVWLERYHARALRTPREVRNALVYVLQNARKHIRGVNGLDPCSSASWFTGWTQPVSRIGSSPPIAHARTWLAAVGWRRWGLIRFHERPAPSRRR